MQLVINTYGAYLRKQGDCFLVKNDDKTFEVSVRKVDSSMPATSIPLPRREPILFPLPLGDLSAPACALRAGKCHAQAERGG